MPKFRQMSNAPYIMTSEKDKAYEVFSKEIGLIHSSLIVDFTIEILSILPSYFWTIPASTSGKYHPEYALGEGGLIRHTKAAVHIAKALFELHDFDQYTKDLIISAIILHDGCKCGFPKEGEEPQTQFDHPDLIGQLILEHAAKNKWNYSRLFAAYEVFNLTASHMGKWNKRDLGNNQIYELDLPFTEAQKFVHECDYLASRKFIEIDFEKV